MKTRQMGFTLVELLVAISIMAAIGATASMALDQVNRGTEYSNNSITVVQQVQNAGYWISRDVQKAHSIIAENLTAPEFLIINWTEWDEHDNPIYHTVKYLIEDLNDDIGKLTRNHWSSDGVNQKTLIAEYIYYQPGDTGNTSRVYYTNPEITLKLTAIFEKKQESREYRIMRRSTL